MDWPHLGCPSRTPTACVLHFVVVGLNPSLLRSPLIEPPQVQPPGSEPVFMVGVSHSCLLQPSFLPGTSASLSFLI